MAVDGLAGRADVVARAFDQGGRHVVVLRGPLDRFAEDTVREALLAAGDLPLVVDLAGVERLGIDVLAVFLDVRGHGGLVLAGPFAPAVDRTLEASGTREFFARYETLDDALRDTEA
ncbi:STAS domain-containing protein [Streptomyces fuscigenes]|uniref:STAS domain-containing protein n=1 Tax=Streptomyces fuscigenes TaxID=1528880 RepID=UPI001F3270AA|nr:STAS domain-containing protein [Streptomyces fuscigenes]MCF3961872.1 STAS domain-containing protein [Streptomyces fuscigenes]